MGERREKRKGETAKGEKFFSLPRFPSKISTLLTPKQGLKLRLLHRVFLYAVCFSFHGFWQQHTAGRNPATDWHPDQPEYQISYDLRTKTGISYNFVSLTDPGSPEPFFTHPKAVRFSAVKLVIKLINLKEETIAINEFTILSS